MADYVLPSVVEKRVRYFDGQFLQDQDFIDEQDYQLDREHRHNRLLHGPGITEGLSVTSAGPNQVTVSAGSAIDSDGRQLVLAQATTVDLPAADFNDKQGIQLLISYLESAEDPQTVGGSQDFTRWLERPTLTALAPGETYSGSYPTVLLMTLALDGSGRVTGDNSPRVYSGLLLPGLGTGAATLAADSGGAAQLSGSLSVTGSVGIGTNPGFPLHLAAGKALRIDGGTGAGDDAAYFSFGGDGAFNIDARNQAGGRLTVQDSGNVGIGTASPGARLEVVGGGVDSVDLLVNGRLRSNSDEGGLWVSTDRFIGGIGTGVGFWSGNAWRLLVLPSGNVGIGTATPGTNLAVAGTTSLIGNVGIGTASPASALHVAQGKALRIDGGTGADDNAAYFSFGGNGTFNIDAVGTTGGRFTVQNSGNVGIGTNSPSSLLHVNVPSPASGATAMHLAVGSTGSPVTAMQIDVASFVTSANTQASYFLRAQDIGSGITQFAARGDGTLYASGGLNVQVGSTWQKLGNSALTTTGASSPSDRRLKDSVRPIGPALDLVRQLRGVRYRWSETGLAHFTRDIDTSVSAGPDATPEQHEKARQAERDRTLDRLAGDYLGLIAQDVEAVVPELVLDGEDGYKQVRYQHLTALLTEAIKEQDAVVRALAAEVASLRSAQTAPSA
jgi:Chaperone of endosialidase